MAGTGLEHVVSDWGGFEKLVAKLHETGSVTVEANVFLVGKSGARRQIDVLVRHKQGLYEHLIVVQCKYWQQRIKRLHVDALATELRDLSASRGVIFSAKGFQKCAITQAKQEGIDLFKVREPTDEEWGAPGRCADFFIQIAQPSIANVALHETQAAGPVSGPIALNLSALVEDETCL